MNKLLLPLIFLTSCSYRPQHSDPFPSTITPFDHVQCFSHSAITWKATEMFGTRERVGTVTLDSACIQCASGVLVGGYFTVDMNTIDPTDLPAHEVTAKKNLVNHLKSPDFFRTDDFPQARMHLIHVQKFSTSRLRIKANLQIREVTRGIEFQATLDKGYFSTTLHLNREEWNVAFQGSLLEKTLIDPVFTLTWSNKYCNNVAIKDSSP
jgi:polyisoprenoid-binding protein YceI